MSIHAFKRKSVKDRPDGKYVRDITGIQALMMNIYPNRTDSEVYLSDQFDATELLKYLEKKNAEHPDYKTTLFHCALTALARMVKERPYLNRFIQGRRMYQRYEISLSFVAKRMFKDGAEEALMVLTPSDGDTLDTISRQIVGDVTQMRKNPAKKTGSDAVIDNLAKLPRPLLMLVSKLIRILDFWGYLPHFVWETDVNYSTILASNLGSIKCPSVYHHLNNYGTNSIMVTIGTLHKEQVLMPDGSVQIRDMIDIGATLDERIADGFYFARSLKLIKYIFENPEILEQPIGTPSGFEYK
jgi:pyruvate/2-oxoglutarate dehydrogenase complex dihydrolipoamide acyltransferase (E2) component